MLFRQKRDINKLLLPWAAVLSHFLSCNFGTDRFRHWLSAVEGGLSQHQQFRIIYSQFVPRVLGQILSFFWLRGVLIYQLLMRNLLHLMMKFPSYGFAIGQMHVPRCPKCKFSCVIYMCQGSENLLSARTQCTASPRQRCCSQFSS